MQSKRNKKQKDKQEKDKQKAIKIKGVTFKKQITIKQINKLFDQQIKQLITSEIWFVRLTAHLKTYIQIFKLIETAQFKQLHIMNQQQARIISYIQIPRYLNMISLYLCGNQINNIENMTFLDIEKIQFIHLGNNNIVNLKSLNKTNWKQFNLLNIYRNKCTILDINRMKINKNFKAINHENIFSSSKLQSNTIQDIFFYFKLQLQSIDKVCLNFQTKIYQPKFQNLLNHKFPYHIHQFKLN